MTCFFSLCLDFVKSSGVQQSKMGISEMLCGTLSLAQIRLVGCGTGDDLPALWPLELCSLHHWDR